MNQESDCVAHVSLPDIKKPQSSMTHHLDLVRSGVASIETELQQRASLLAVDNSNLRYVLTLRITEYRRLFDASNVQNSPNINITKSSVPKDYKLSIFKRAKEI